jgi:hypothetical protein
MNTLFDRLNLRPQERRLVVMAATVLFVVFHFWFVHPYFKEWGRTKAAVSKAQNTLKIFRATLAQTNDLRLKLQKLEGQGTGLLAPEQAGNLLIQRIGAQARENDVKYSRINILPRSATAKAGEFFEEQTLDFGVNPSGDKELIAFLVAIGNSDLMVRVKELSLGPAPGGYQLQGSMKLVASFQKKGAPATTRPGTLSSTRP